MSGANGNKLNVTCPNCKIKQTIYERFFDGAGKKCKNCWLTINSKNVKSSDCNNWNHGDCYNSKGACNCRCHKPGTDEYIRYEKKRKQKREKKK